MKVPILNLYYMLCYAWNMLDEGRVVDVSAEPFQSLPDLFARVLRTGVTHLLRRGLDRGYLPHEEDARSPRGKFDLAATVKRNLRLRSRVHCKFDDFRPDVLHNQILKATLIRLARCEDLVPPLQADIASLCRRLHDVTPADLSPDVFDRVVIHRHNRFYAFLVEVCRILYWCLLVDPATGRTWFRDFLGDEMAMARLFERFVYNFYCREKPEFECDSKKVLWSEVEGDSEALAFLPEMRTDITLSAPPRTFIIDTKYYAQCLQSYQNSETIHSGHLYQLFAYLRNIAPGHPHPDHLEGVLLYPVVTRSLDLRFRLHGHPIRVATLDLNQPWTGIRDRLLMLLD
jgi:5-methylcytosine-specific restriction enzyme subunit McrC